MGLVGAALFLADIPLSRPFFVALFLVGPLLLLLVRAIARRGVNLARTRGQLRSQVLVVGSTGHVRGIVRTLARETWLGYDVVGAIAPISDVRRDEGAGVPILGDESELLDLVRAQQPDIVLFTAGSSASAEEFRRVAWELEGLDVGVIVVPGVSEISGDRIRMRPVAGLPLVHMDLPRARKALRRGKRLFDIVASAALLLLLTPVLGIVALCVRLSDGGGVVFRQQRVGRTGEPFEFLKFRSMVVDAEARRAELEQLARDRGNDVLFKMSDDPRITRVGKVLRRYSLDELPQLWNVLRGDMSLVGPRPALPQEVTGYDGDAHRRLAVRPGITGLWQVSGRSDLSWEDTVRLDLFYVDNWSFAQDLLILARTARAVLASRGAY
ncbi:sugar transferase [Brachybacterium sp. Z12]|uniref:sugar transferase n=1 Tax=Brachybacterium sp. Z12 TaxID=2759167 RepID=UPI00223AB55B|nr:sugar transferase [Brachybacterium sp. Z12]